MNVQLSSVYGHIRQARRTRRRATAFTLVEMLVAMAVTVILIGALAQAYAILGDVLASGRAVIELSGTLRGVAHQLQEDLDGITVQARPWADESSASGYLQIVEGPERTTLPSTDSDWGRTGSFTTDGTYIDQMETITNSMLGDVDDILAFTTRNARAPFRGQYVDASDTVQPIESSLAEVVWWIQYYDEYFSDPDEANGQRDDHESFLIYRRALLIRPDLNNAQGFFRRFDPVDDAPVPPNVTADPDGDGPRLLRARLADFFARNDISVRLRAQRNSSDQLVVTAIANSLADLTRRENRFAHWPILSDRSPTEGPNPQFSRPRSDTSGNSVAVPSDPPYDSLELGRYRAFSFDVNRRSITSLYRLAKPRLLPGATQNDPPRPNPTYGDDVMVSNALSFDVRVFDPMAPIRRVEVNGEIEALEPGDPGYLFGYSTTDLPPNRASLTQNNYNNSVFRTQFLGLGAFVDLGYGIRSAFPEQCADWSYFSNRPTPLSMLPFNPNAATSHPGDKVGVYEYCTWSTHYEYGIDQDFNYAGQRATSPPYPHSLRGIQVRLRAWDPDSRQVRQATVVSNFVPE